MKTTVEFLDAVKAKHGLTSDYQLSKHLDCTRGAISSYRMGKSYLDEEMACKVAADLGIDSSYVLACVASERARKPEIKAAWAHAAELLYGLAASLAVIAVTLTYVYGDIMSAHLFQMDGASLLALAGFNVTGQSIHYANFAFLAAAFAALLFYAFPRHNPRPRKEPDTASR